MNPVLPTSTVIMIALVIAVLSVIVHLLRPRLSRSHRAYSPLSSDELRAVADEDVGAGHAEHHANGARQLTLIGQGEATRDDIWDQQVAVVERALDQALIRAGDDSGTYSATSLRRTSEQKTHHRSQCWRIPAPYADEVLHRLPRPGLHPGLRLLADLSLHT